LILSQDRPRVESFISTDDECFYEGNTGIVLWRQTDSRIEFKTGPKVYVLFVYLPHHKSNTTHLLL